MRFSLTGDQPKATLIIEAITASNDHQLSHCHIAGELEQLLTSVPLGAERVESAEAAIIARHCDGVIIAVADSDESVRLARHASQANRHVVLVPPQDVSIAWSYELGLLLDESQCGIIVLSASFYQNNDKAVTKSESEYELELPAMGDDPAHLATLCDAVDIVRSLGFADGQVTVLGITDDGRLPVSRQIVLSDGATHEKKRPTIALRFAPGLTTGQLTSRTASDEDFQVLLPGHISNLPRSAASNICQRIEELLTDRDACRLAIDRYSETLQIVAAVDKSIRRRRTVDVSKDDLTERAAFKTQMTAIGCGVLTWMMLALIGYLLIGLLFSPPEPFMQILRALWILPVVLFLLAQFLLPIARGRIDLSSDTSAEDPTS